MVHLIVNNAMKEQCSPVKTVLFVASCALFRRSRFLLIRFSDPSVVIQSLHTQTNPQHNQPNSVEKSRSRANVYNMRVKTLYRRAAEITQNTSIM
jgi:hypothetical protein